MQINNQVTLIGRLGADPIYVTTQNGADLTRFSLATSSQRKDKEGKSIESTQWHRCVAWGPLAIQLHKFLGKGRKIAIHGQLRYNKYTDKEGVKRNSTDIVVSDFSFIDKKPEAKAA
ncbi:MAG: single-stranded DNA-binding protein [Bacteroidota bacterium]